jgi:hypothetical protein
MVCGTARKPHFSRVIIHETVSISYIVMFDHLDVILPKDRYPAIQQISSGAPCVVQTLNLIADC